MLLTLVCRLHLYDCAADEVTEAVSTLASLPSLRSCSLGIWARHLQGSELDFRCIWEERLKDVDWQVDDDFELCPIPALGSVPGLTALSMFGVVEAPPDLRRLSALKRLDAMVPPFWTTFGALSRCQA
jgi:hypothetical protein